MRTIVIALIVGLAFAGAIAPAASAASLDTPMEERAECHVVWGDLLLDLGGVKVYRPKTVVCNL